MAASKAPQSLVEASELGRREFLVFARRKIAQEIDGGVPPHTLGRLISEMDRLDGEIRRFDDAEEANELASIEDEPFDMSLI